MHRVDDDARQTRGIEQAFFKVEFPGSVLLRQQQPLQAVGEPRDHALQMRKLLVEIAAQPLELLRIAEVLGTDDLIEFGGKGPIIRPAGLVAIVPRPPRLGRGLRIAHLCIVGRISGRCIDGFRRAVGQFLGGGLGLFNAHALVVCGIGGFAVPAGLVATVLFLAVFTILLVGFA